MKSLSSKTYQCGVTIQGLTTLAGITYLTGITNTTSWDHVIVGTTAQGQIYTRTYAQFMTDVATGIGLSGYVPTSRTLTINGVTFDLSANRTWTIATPTLDQVTTAGNTTANTIDVGGVTTNYLLLDTTATPSLVPAMVRWNDSDGVPEVRLKGNNVTGQMFLEDLIRVVNKTDADLLEADFRVVRIRSVAEGGSQGQRLAVKLAQADVDLNSATTIGVVTETILNNQEGFITRGGEVRNINTTGAKSWGGLETWVDGDILYLSPDHAGYLTNIKPTAPNHTVVVGWIAYAHAIQGKIHVKVDNGYELEELHDVLPTPYINNGVLYRDTATNLWKSSTISTLLGYTPANASGTTNYLSKFTGSTTLGNSLVYDNGTNVGVGTSSPGATLDVSGSLNTGKSIVRVTNSDTNNYITIGAGIPTISNAGMNFTVDGTSRMVISSSGNVGIGTTGPDVKFSVTPSTDVSAKIGYAFIGKGTDAGLSGWAVFGNIGAQAANQVALSQSGTGLTVLNAASGQNIRFRIANVDKAIIDLNGNVGIGTTTPSTKLDVMGAMLVNGGTNSTDGIKILASLTSSAFTSGIEFIRTTVVAGSKIQPLRDTVSGGVGLSLLVTANNAAEVAGTYTSALSILNNGNVGIGTTSPLAKLVVSNGTQGIEMGYSAGLAANFIQSISRPTGVDVDMAYYLAGAGVHKFYSNGLESVRITNAGNVGIGTASPSTKLDVSGVITATGGNSTNWNTAYGWGNHAGLYALLVHTHSAADITSGTLASARLSGSYAIDISGASSTSNTLTREDNRTISPSELAAGQLKFGFTSWANNNSAPYADFLHLRSYTDASGGSDNLVMFKKSGLGMRLWQQTWGSTSAYSSYVDVWTTGDFTSTSVSNWNTAYGWGNHASAGYLTSITRAQVHTAIFSTGGDANTYTAFGIYRNYAVNGPVGAHNTILNVMQTDGNYGFQLGADTTSTADGLYYRSKDATIGTWKQVASRDWVNTQAFVPQARTLTINGTTYDLSANRSWTIPNDLQTAANGSKVTTPVNVGPNVISSVSVGSYDGATFNYVIKDGTNFRAGTVIAVWNGTIVQYNETTTNDIGNTTSVVMSVAITAGNAELIATSSTPGWTAKVVPMGI